MKIKKSMSSGIIINVLALILTRGFVIISAPYMTDVLTTDEYGIISVFNTWSNVVYIIASLGAVSGLKNYKINKDEKTYHEYCWNSLIVGVIPHLFIFMLSVLLRDYFAVLLKMDSKYPPLIVLSSLTIHISSFFTAYLIIENDALKNLIVSAFSFGAYFSFAFIATEYTTFFTGCKELPFVLGTILSNGIVGIVAIVYFAKKGIGKIKKEYVDFCIKMGIPIIFHSLSSIILSSSDRVMIQRMRTDSEAGIYSFTYSFASIIVYVWGAINSIWSPFYFRLLKEGDDKKLKAKRFNFDYVYSMLFAGFILVYPEFMSFLSSSDEYLQNSNLIIIIAMSFIANHIYSFSSGYEMYREKNIYVAVGTITAALCNVLLNILMIPSMGAFGASLATLISYILLAAFHRIISSIILKGYPMKNYFAWFPVFVSVLSVLVSIFGADYWLFRWGVAFLVGILIIVRTVKNRCII